MPSTSLGSKIYELRKKKKLTQSGLAELVGVSGGAISQFESGINLPSPSTQEKLSKALDFDLIGFSLINQQPREMLKDEDSVDVVFVPLSDYPWFESFAEWYRAWWHGHGDAGLASKLSDEEWNRYNVIMHNRHYTTALSLPNINYDRAFVVEIKGNSMAPRYPHGSRYVAMLVEDFKYSTGVHLFCFHAKSLFVRRIISNKDGVLTLRADATGEESTLQLDEVNKLREQGLFMALKLGQGVHMPPEE